MEQQEYNIKRQLKKSKRKPASKPRLWWECLQVQNMAEIGSNDLIKIMYGCCKYTHKNSKRGEIGLIDLSTTRIETDGIRGLN
jgi:hypothetical protein